MDFEDVVLEETAPKVTTQPSKFRNFLNYLKDLRGESIMLFYSLSYYILTVFTSHFFWVQICFRKNYGDHFCLTSMGQNQSIETEIQREETELIFAYYLVKTLPSVILLLFWGPWSDLHGRLFPTIAPMIGTILNLIVFILVHEFRSWPLYVLIIAAIPAGLSGDYSCFMMGFFGWVNDAHSIDILTTKMSTVNGVETLMIIVAPLLGQALFAYFGYTVLFTVSIVSMLIALVLAIIFIKDDKYPPAPLSTLLFDMINYKNVVSIVKTMTAVRVNNFRLYYNLMLLSIIPIAFSFFGHQNIIGLYLRLVAQFGLYMYSIYSAVQGIMCAIGFLILAPILVQVAKLQEPILGIMSNIAFSIFYICTGLLSSTIGLFVVIAFQIVGIISLLTTRAFVSKCVEHQEIGKAMSLVGVTQVIGRNLGQIVSTKMYYHTMLTFPGSFHIFAGIILLVSIAINIFIFIDLRKYSTSAVKVN